MTVYRPYSPDWLDDEGAAYALCLPVSTFREYVAAGALPRPVKIGKHTRWSREALNTTLAEMARPGKTDSITAKIREFADGEKEKGGRHAA